MTVLRALIVAVLLSVLGCSARDPSAPAPTDPSLATIRAVLQQIAAGEAISPSHRGGLLSGIENLNKTAPQKAAALDKDAREMLQVGAGDPKRAQAMAKELLTKLDAQK